MANSGLYILANTQFFSTAFQFCSGPTLCSLRACNRLLAEELPKTSHLWQELVAQSTAVLRPMPTTHMHQAIRLGRVLERCSRCGDAGGESEDKRLRHRIIVTGARHSGVSTLVQLMAEKSTNEPFSGIADMSVSSFGVDLEGHPLKISVVDKRSTAISTPFSAALYNGHTAALFVFDAGNMESLQTAVRCIEDLKQTVGSRKFQQMPKLLVCHKADLLPSPARSAVLPACRALLTDFGMDLVFTSQGDLSSVQLAFALVAERWPEQDPDKVSRRIPTIARHQLRPTRTVRRGFSYRLGTVVTETRRPGPANILEELRARVALVE